MLGCYRKFMQANKIKNTLTKHCQTGSIISRVLLVKQA